MTEDGGKEISRRDFLKKSFTNIAAAGLAINARESFFGPKKPEYIEIDGKSTITLFEGNSTSSVEFFVNYFSTKDKLQVRMEKGTPKFLAFTPDTKQVRLFGEMIEPKLFKVKVNRDLIDPKYNVGVYPTASGNLNNTLGRTEFPEHVDVFGISVIVGPVNYFPGSKLPTEINANPPGEKWEDVGNFGKGFLVGTMQDINGRKEFTSLGYVCDSRALVTE